MITKNSSNTALRSRAYTYDDASRIATQTVESVTTTYGYDNADQLTSESRSGYVASYTYDGNGNRLTKTLNSVTDAYSYDDGDKLLAITRGGNEYKDYTYDACGRTATISDENTTQTFSYDYEDRVTSISGLATTNTFAYNGLDTRVKMVNSTGTSDYKRVGAGVTDSVVSDGAATYTPGVSERRSGVTAYLHSGLEDADAQSGSSQTVGASRTYDAFGAVVSSSGTWKGPFGYAGSFGYQEDADTSYQLLGHRYYDASTGRFLTRDPVKDGRNWYAYCENSPLDGVDATGLSKGGTFWKVIEWIERGASRIMPGQAISRQVALKERLRGKSVIAPSMREAHDLDQTVSGGGSWLDGPHDVRHDGTPNVDPMPHYQNDVVGGHTFFRWAFWGALIKEATEFWDPTPVGLGRDLASIAVEFVEPWAGANDSGDWDHGGTGSYNQWAIEAWK